jgi:hypothetical protein
MLLIGYGVFHVLLVIRCQHPEAKRLGVSTAGNDLWSGTDLDTLLWEMDTLKACYAVCVLLCVGDVIDALNACITSIRFLFQCQLCVLFLQLRSRLFWQAKVESYEGCSLVFFEAIAGDAAKY